MPRVTLRRAWNPGTAMYVAGDVVDVDDETAEWLERSGALAAPKAAKKTREPEAPTGQPQDVAPKQQAPAPAKEAPARPARTAPVDTWRAYAEAQGINPKGLSKAELIAATT